MQRLNPGVTAAFVGAAGIVAIGLAMPVHAQSARVSPVSLEHRSARLTRGSISGTVSDERGGPLSGAMISALSGVTSATAVTDPRGRFLLELPAGEYIVRAHMTGFAASPRQVVRVSGLPSEHRFELRKLDLPVATTGTPVSARPIVAAGFDLPRPPASGPDADATDEKHPHNEMSWRLRHIKRGILKDASPAIVVADNETTIGSPSLFGRATDSVAMLASSLFSDFPFRGEVNFLTTSALAPGQMLFSEAGLPRGVAYLSLGAPAPGGEWTIRAAMSQGDLSSWIVAGAFDSREVGAHTYNLGLTYSTQEYQGGNPAALAAVTDGSRNVGELYAFDRWAAARRITLEYGARYAHYDYLENRGLLSPRVGVTLEPFERTRVRATVAQRMVAPGAEEFLSPVAPGPWLPPERTFAPLGGPGDLDVFRIERARSLDLALEHEFPSTYLIGVRRFYQNVDDQLVTLFGLNVPGGPESVGHYYVASAGAVDAQGWALRLRSATTLPIRGTIDYSVTRARWLSRGDMAAVAPLAPAAIRPATEDLHDLTTSFETEIAETATRVFVLYKINTGYTRANTDLIRPGLDARFDVQVNQGLPLSVAGTKWEILVGVRNLFRDPNDPGSVYDELLVVRPPKRVVGGFLVRF